MFHAAVFTFSTRHVRIYSSQHFSVCRCCGITCWWLVLEGWLAACLSAKHNLWLGFMVRGESRPHELFSFIWRCYSCSLSACACLPLFNLSLHHLSLCLSFPVFLLVWVLLIRYCCCVTAKRCCCQGNVWVVSADVCNLGNCSLTCSGFNPPYLLSHPRHKSSVIPHSVFLLNPTYDMIFVFLILSSSFSILLILFHLLLNSVLLPAFSGFSISQWVCACLMDKI